MSVIEFLSNLLIPVALAENGAPAAAQGGGFMSFLPLIIIFAIFYFLLIRPQQKRAKEHRDLVSKLTKGDEVVAAGGLYGRVSDLDETSITLEVANGVSIKVQRQSVGQVLPKGTIK